MEIGCVEAIFRYPVKSMRGERLESAQLGWHGIEADRRMALRRLDNRGAFPWLSATTLPELLLYRPVCEGAGRDMPTHVATPDGRQLPMFSEDLATDIESRHGAPVQMMQLKHGIFDDATVSVIATDTVDEICHRAECVPNVRRFRPNILVRLLRGGPFQEDAWVGGLLTFGDGEDAPVVAVTMRDIRCAMVNFDPDSAMANPNVLKAVVRANDNNAGVYGTVTRAGRIAVGQAITLRTV